ncbi:DUF983 domain-containing protein [Pseudochrobactrum sp. sp1633]|uniref:DUF983 domain-containing protein n=1 Tax=Pseudochrobactrum sp. sp1633 TaxID=3036706 RepID=UPI0025A57532|nr:DUF983 domain-containing protein [Pseudochrobactrum sp. sp1633]MDM8344813.1 DUF983 domain-containing protein [Pseudochrobactrum sp. sp1633]HWD13426.1 DUF983 domain-containing protein [Pseudochrobactrum sp.]
MSSDQSVSQTDMQIFGGESAKQARATRPLGQAMKRGLLSRCPNCGDGKLFRSFLRPVANCSVCDEDYTAQRADDLPAYLTVLIVGHVVIALFMMVENMGGLSLWGHLAIWGPVTILMSLALLQPMKGATIGLQWALYMHGFDTESTKEYI